MQTGVIFSEMQATLTAKLSGEIDHHLARSQREEIDRMLFRAKPAKLILDFSEVRFMDSSGLGLIMGRADICRELGCVLEITGLSPQLKKLMKLSGMEKIKEISVV